LIETAPEFLTVATRDELAMREPSAASRDQKDLEHKETKRRGDRIMAGQNHIIFGASPSFIRFGCGWPRWVVGVFFHQIFLFFLPSFAFRSLPQPSFALIGKGGELRILNGE
jgi:hypothetical protein